MSPLKSNLPILLFEPDGYVLDAPKLMGCQSAVMVFCGLRFIPQMSRQQQVDRLVCLLTLRIARLVMCLKSWFLGKRRQLKALGFQPIE